MPRLWSGALRRDGSQFVPPAADRTPIVQNENPLKEADRVLRAGDEGAIAREIRAINAIGIRKGARVVFLVPPVYEMDRHDSVVNRIFDRALALAPDVTVIDHREMRSNISFFESGIHASPRYYRLVGEELRSRGFVK